MSEETRKIFESKRKKAELLYRLYWWTGFFIVYKLFKLISHILFHPKLLKSSSQFEKEENSDVVINAGIGKDTKILHKIPSPKKDRAKPKTRWFAKLQPDDHGAREVMTAGVFQLLLGKAHAAKVQLMKDEATGQIYTLSKLFEDFQTFRTILNKPENKEKSYAAYMQATEGLPGYKKMLAVTILLGRRDCYENNWGVVENSQGRFAVTFDYGIAAGSELVEMYDMLKTNLHFYQHIVCEEFIQICEALIEEFEQKHDEIEELLLKGVDTAEAVYWWWQIPTVNEVMRIFTRNKQQLEYLCHHIRAELAILQGNAGALNTALEALDTSTAKEARYARVFSTMCFQRRADFFLESHRNFSHLISYGYDRVFICSGIPDKTFKFEVNALYLVKNNRGILAYHCHLNYNPDIYRSLMKMRNFLKKLVQ